MKEITRGSFFNRALKYALRGLAAAGTLDGLVPTRASAQQASTDGAKTQNWLTVTDEPALEPALPIIDPHHHLSDRPGDCHVPRNRNARLPAPAALNGPITLARSKPDCN